MSALREKRAGDGRQARALTREDVIDALREYGRRYGPDFVSASFNPATARWQRRPDLVDRYRAGRMPDGRPWPSLNAIRKVMAAEPRPAGVGPWDAARLAAGFTVNSAGPRRRRSGEIPADMPHERVRVVTRLTDESRRLAREVALAKDRERDARAALASARAEVAELRRRPVPVCVDERAVARARAETDRERDRAQRLSRELVNARRREERLRVRLDEPSSRVPKQEHPAMKPVAPAARTLMREADAPTDVDARAPAGVLAEVDRLTGLLAATEARAARVERQADFSREKAAAESVLLRAAAADAVARAQVADEATARARAADARARAADQRARAAARRVETVEADLHELAKVVTGQRRRLTSDEVKQLRRRGPAGPAVLSDALRKLAQARKGRGDLAMALTSVAEAAIGWRDRV